MNFAEANPERESFISFYAIRLKELNDTPYSRRHIRDLERMAERCLESVENALAGDMKSLERYISHIILQLSREGFRSWQIIKGLGAFRDAAKRLPSVLGDCVRVDDVLQLAIVRFSQLYEDLQTEQGLVRMVDSLTMALDSKEPYTSAHCHSVKRIAEKLGRVLGVDVGLAGLLHDIGKIHVPDKVLTKQGPLTAAEWVLLQQHPYHSFRILCPINPEIASICLRHHERPDGRGYPLGETDVRLEANVISAADTLHAICSKRSYRNATRLSVALDQIRANKGGQFLPEVVGAVDKAFGDVAGLLGSFAAQA